MRASRAPYSPPSHPIATAPCHTITLARSIIDTCKSRQKTWCRVCGICHIHAALGDLTELLNFGLPTFCLELGRTCFENVDKLIKYPVNTRSRFSLTLGVLDYVLNSDFCCG